VVADVRATLRASRNGLWTVGWLLVTSLTATSFLLWTQVRMPWVGIATAPIMLVRIAVVLLAFSAAYRLALAPRERPWALDRGFFAFAAALVLVTAIGVVAALALGRATVAAAAAAGLSPATAFAVRGLAGLAALVALSCALLRVQPWLAALASRREGFTLAHAWRGTSGRMTSIVKGWAVIVLPAYLVHAALNVLALNLLPFGPASLLLAALDAIVCAGIVMGAAMLNATALRWIAGEAIPAPNPFSTEAPPPALVEEARLRLRHLAGPRPQPVSAA
jgi:hypothetical protein